MNEIIGAGAPFSYDYMNVVGASYSPSEIHVSNTKLAGFFRRYLLQKAMSRFEWTLPSTWNKDYFLYSLYTWGHLAIINTNKFGVIPQACGLKGYDVYYRPTHATIANPCLTGILEPQIGKQCTIIKLQPDYGGMMDIVSYYGDMLALCAETAAINLLNSKLAYVFTADSKAAAESFKRLYDNIASGQPAVVQDKSLALEDGSPAWNTFTQDLKGNYIAGDILSDMRKWEADFDTRIGIANANTDKRERLITDEVNANNEETRSMASLWLEELQASIKDACDMFKIDPAEFNVKWRELNIVEGGTPDDRIE